MKYTVERIFSNIKYECLGWSYQNFDDMLKDLIYAMVDKIGHPFIGEQYHNLRFIMNIPLYHEFLISCQMSCHDSEWYRGIKIIEDTGLYIGSTDSSPDGIVRLVYEDSSHHDDYINCLRHCINRFETKEEKKMPPKDGNTKTVYFDNLPFTIDRGHGFQKVPHINHVKFNGPATIVFWKDGTKTVVKHDGKGRKDKRLAILYAFIRKIYGEGKPYHNILNEIEEAIKNEKF